MSHAGKLRHYRRQAERRSQALNSSPSPAAAQFMDDMNAAAERLEQLEAFVRGLDIQIMHPDMGGEHQATIRANGRKLTQDDWYLIRSCEDGAS